MWLNNITKEMDKHLIDDFKGTFEDGYGDGSYFWPEIKKDESICPGQFILFRFPGATRGMMQMTDDDIITKFIFYPTTGVLNESIKNCVGCYKGSVVKAMEKFIGTKFEILKDDGLIQNDQP